MKRRNLILLLGGASSGAMSVGTGAFSSVEAERGVEVNVVEDERAYLGLDDEAGEGFVRIKNQFSGDLDLTVTASLPDGNGAIEMEADESDEEDDEKEDDEDVEEDGDDHEDAGKIEIEVESDENEDDDDSPSDNSVDVTVPTGNFVDVTVECDGGGTLTLELIFLGTVLNTGTTVDKTREFSIDCGSEDGGQGVSSVTFKSGNSGITINASDGMKRDATVYYEGNGSSGLEKASGENKSANEVLKLKQDFGGPNNGGEIVGVAIDETDGVFVHPAFEQNDCEIPGNGGNVEVTEKTDKHILDDCLD